MSIFESELRKLNPQQREAVETIEGPVMVIAGPGTGKTQILTLRIANILARTDTAPDCILALTFTESAVANMRRRLVSFMGSTAYYVNIHTFHGFCNRLIREHPEHFDFIIGCRRASEIDTLGIIRKILEKNSLERLKPFGDTFFHVGDIRKAIKDIKNEGIDPDTFVQLVKNDEAAFAALPDKIHAAGKFAGHMKGAYKKRAADIAKNRELTEVFQAYVRAMRANKLYDFEDMILETIRAFTAKPDFLLELQEHYQYMLVDEHQDTNGAQNKVLELLCNFYPNPNLFVVGDEKQAIFRFQGASLDNFLYFKNKFSEVKLINLEENYRSTQKILDSASSLIQKNHATLPTFLTSQKKEAGEPIRIISFSVPEAEPYFLAQDIRECIASSTPAAEIAVLYRENRDAEPIARFLEKCEVPFVVESDENILQNPDIQKFLIVLEAVNAFGDEEKLVPALHVDFLDLDPLDIWRLVKSAGEQRMSVYNILARKELLESLDLEQPDKLHKLYGNLARWKKQSANMLFTQFFETVMEESGFLAHLIASPRAAEKITLLVALFREVQIMAQNHRDARLVDFIQYLAIVHQHRVMIKSKSRRHPNAVRLMTAHRAKGLEFEAVYITGVVDGHWGNMHRADYFTLPLKTASQISALEKNEDERRLFYMALTRAKRHLTLTHAQVSTDGREQVPSQFLAEIREELRQEIPAKPWEERYAQACGELFTPAKKGSLGMKNVEFLRELFSHKGLSATALNNYLACPWKYFYRNLIRIPGAQTPHQLYGIAIHYALQRFFDARNAGGDPDADYIAAQFAQALKKEPLSEVEFDRYVQKGTRTLGAYVRFYQNTWSQRTVNEFNIKGVHLPSAVFTDGILLTGKLDKLEIQPNGRDVVVVDYKAKEAQSRNWIEGKTANSTGDYFRQLVFYQLLMNMKPDNPYRMTAGVVDFIEPNERGVFRREAFEITDEHVRELKEVITHTCDEILGVKFWSRRCQDKKCAYCKLRELMPDA